MESELEGTTRDKSEVEVVLEEILEIHRKKAADYSRPEEAFSNFIEAAEQSGVTPLDTVEVLIGIKTARIKNLRSKLKGDLEEQMTTKVNNEPLADSYLDRAVYAIIAYAMAKKWVV